MLLWPTLFVLLFTLSCSTSTFKAKGGWSGPVVSGDTIYAGTRDGRLMALDAATGATKWKFPSAKDKNIGPVYGTPAIDSSGWVYVAGYDGKLYAIDTTSPKLSGTDAFVEASWDFSANKGIIGSPTVAGDKVLVGSSDGNLYALNARDGKLVWQTPFKTGNEIWSQPTVDGKVVYFGSLDHSLYAVDLDTGKKVWSFSTKGGIASRVQVVGDKVYFGTFEGIFYSLNKATGKETNRFKAGGWLWASPVSDDSMFYLGSLDRKFYALDKNSLKLGWPEPLETKGQIVGAAALVGDRVVIPSEDGNLYVARKSDGRESQICALGSAINAPLFPSGNMIYLAAMDNSIRAISIDDRGNPDEVWVRFLNKDEPEPRSREKAC